MASKSFPCPLINRLNSSNSSETIRQRKLSFEFLDFAMLYPLPDFVVRIIVFTDAQKNVGVFWVVPNAEPSVVHDQKILRDKKSGSPVAACKGVRLNQAPKQNSGLAKNIAFHVPARIENLLQSWHGSKSPQNRLFWPLLHSMTTG